MRRLILLCALILLAMVSVVGLWPEGQVALTSGCEPNGTLASFRSSMQGRLFWRRQLREIDDEMAWIKAYPKARARARSLSRDLDEEMRREDEAFRKKIYSEYPQIRPHPAESEETATALRAQADAIERAESDSQDDSMMAKWLAQLQRCRPIAQSRAR